jgi:hypothetical protein
MANTDMDDAVLVARVTLGLLYVIHAVLLWAVFASAPSAQYFAGAELLGGAMLIFGCCTRTVAVALFPVAVATVVLHSAASIGIAVSEIAYLAGCLAGMALVAGAIRTAADDEQPQDTGHVTAWNLFPDGRSN